MPIVGFRYAWCRRYQSVRFTLLTDTVIPEIYGRDGSLVRIKAMDEDSKIRSYTNRV